MKRTTMFLLVALALAAPTMARGALMLGPNAYESCQGQVIDEAGILGNATGMQPGITALIDQGADVHVVSVANLATYGRRLADVERAYEQRCSSWTAPNGGRKANLFVIMVAPHEKLKNAFFGSAYTPVFRNEDTVNNIFSTAANPYFRKGQFGDGISAALKDFAGKVTAYHDQQKHPVTHTTTVNQQATDLHGLWVFLGCLLGLLVLCLGGYWILSMMRKQREDREALDAAQQDAIAAQSTAATEFRSLDKTLAGADEIAARYSELSGSLKFDPNETFDSPAAYGQIARQWNALTRDIRDLKRPASKAAPRREEPPRERFSFEEPTPRRTYERPAPPPATPPPHYAPPIVQQPFIVRDSGNDFLTGVLVGEALEDRHHRREPEYEPPVYTRPESTPDPDPPRSSGSGSDSGWGSSSDSGSSGSDSSYDSGSSGGGSDSGSGGDSGW